MRIGGLSLFTKTNSRGLFNLAAYHSPHSLTWSWIVSATFDGLWRGFDVVKCQPSNWPRFGFYAHRDNQGLQISLALPGLVLSRKAQREMRFRDLFNSAREREDALEHTNRRLQRDLTTARVSALANVDGGGS